MVGHPSLRMGKWAIDRHQYDRLQPNPPPQNWPQKFSVRLGRLCADGTWQLPNNLSPLVSFSTVLEEKMTNLFFRTKIQKCWFSLPKIPRVFLCFPAIFPTSNMTYYQKSWDRNTRNIGEHRQQVGTSQETALKYIKIIDRIPRKTHSKASHEKSFTYTKRSLYEFRIIYPVWGIKPSAFSDGLRPKRRSKKWRKYLGGPVILIGDPSATNDAQVDFYLFSLPMAIQKMSWYPQLVVLYTKKNAISCPLLGSIIACTLYSPFPKQAKVAGIIQKSLAASPGNIRPLGGVHWEGS